MTALTLFTKIPLRRTTLSFRRGSQGRLGQPSLSPVHPAENTSSPHRQGGGGSGSFKPLKSLEDAAFTFGDALLFARKSSRLSRGRMGRRGVGQLGELLFTQEGGSEEAGFHIQLRAIQG